MRESVADSYEIAIEAAEAALDRAGNGSEATGRRSLIEATWWIAAADSYLFEAYRGRWKSSPSRSRHADLLDGFVWTRSRAIHDPLSLTTLERTGASTSAFSPAFDSGWHWNNWQDVQKISVGRIDPDPRIPTNRDAYNRALGGNDVLSTLRDAIDVLKSVELGALGPVE